MGKHGRSRALVTMIATRTAVADPMATSRTLATVKPTVRRHIGPISDTYVLFASRTSKPWCDGPARSHDHDRDSDGRRGHHDDRSDARDSETDRDFVS